MRKVILLGIGLSFLAGFSAASAAGSNLELIVVTGYRATTDGTGRDQHTIVVSGYAEMQVMPDQATIDVGVINSDKITVKALQANNVEMQNVVAAIRALGIPEEAMQTSKFSIRAIHPPTKGDYGGQDFSVTLGYEVANKISITVSDFTKIPAIIDAAVKAGANSSNSVSFDIKDRKSYDDKVLAAAVVNARHNAVVMATAENAKVGQMTSMSKFGEYGPMMDARIVPSNTIELAEEPPILSGEISISAQVMVTYALE